MKIFRKDILAEKKEKAKKVLKDGFETRDWQVLQGSHCDNTEEMVKWTTNFCMDTVVPVRSARCLASNKPWIMKDVDQQNEEGVGGDKDNHWVQFEERRGEGEKEKPAKELL